jgi:hypothetical protein
MGKVLLHETKSERKIRKEIFFITGHSELSVFASFIIDIPQK